jgi:hypothetical protein
LKDRLANIVLDLIQNFASTYHVLIKLRLAAASIGTKANEGENWSLAYRLSLACEKRVPSDHTLILALVFKPVYNTSEDIEGLLDKAEQSESLLILKPLDLQARAEYLLHILMEHHEYIGTVQVLPSFPE